MHCFALQNLYAMPNAPHSSHKLNAVRSFLMSLSASFSYAKWGNFNVFSQVWATGKESGVASVASLLNSIVILSLSSIKSGLGRCGVPVA